MFNPGKRFSFLVGNTRGVGVVLPDGQTCWITRSVGSRSIMKGDLPQNATAIGNQSQDIKVFGDDAENASVHNMLLAVEVSHDLRK